MACGSMVISDKLSVGDQVEVFFLQEWFPGEVVAVDGRATREFDFNSQAKTSCRILRRLRFACPMKAVRFFRTRTYTDSTGKHKTKAALLEILSDSIRIRKEDMKETTVKLDKLSEADQKFIQSLVAQGIGKPATQNLLPTMPNDSRALENQNGNAVANQQPSKSTDGGIPLPSKNAQIVIQGDEFWNVKPISATDAHIVKESDAFPLGWAPISSILSPDKKKLFQFENKGDAQSVSSVDLVTGKYSNLGMELPYHRVLDISNDGSKIMMAHEMNMVLVTSFTFISLALIPVSL